jgi:DNA polymerase-3 subunit beta
MATATMKERKARTGGTSLSVQELSKAVKAVGKAVPAKSPRETLTSVRLLAGVLSGSDSEIRIDVPVNCDKTFKALLPKDRLAAILNAVTADSISLEIEADECVISSVRASWHLPTEPVEAYPEWPVSGLKSVTSMPCDQFARAVRGCVFAVDDDSSRYVLGAVAIEVEEDKVSFVATDGRRLALVECERRQNEATDNQQVLIPAKALRTIASIAEDSGEDCVQLEASSKELVATIGGIRVTALLLAGNFPRWREIMPKRDSKTTTVSRSGLLAATRAAAICTSDDSKAVHYVFSDVIALHGKSSGKGESLIECEVVERGVNCGVKVDPAFVTQWLLGIDGEEEPHVQIDAVDNKSAVVLTCGDNSCLIMPMGDD